MQGIYDRTGLDNLYTMKGYRMKNFYQEKFNQGKPAQEDASRKLRKIKPRKFAKTFHEAMVESGLINESSQKSLLDYERPWRKQKEPSVRESSSSSD